MNLELARQYANLPTYELRRAEAMGFVFSVVEVAESQFFGYFLIRGSFKCVCGRMEYYQFVVHEQEAQFPEAFDVGRKLRSFGSFSREHLIDDGFDPQAVAAMLARGVLFDKQERNGDDGAFGIQRQSETHSAAAHQALWGLPMGTARATWMARPFDVGRVARSGTRGR